ncbi:MAG: hypothetical protein II994_02805 [Lachnospiraceae bacterium]|nr:hypothetical protein [Lachnospiraceae bacterium]
MKYVIECPYCGTTYTVDCEEGNTNFVCDSCGAQNGTAHVVEKINELTSEEKEYIAGKRREDNLKKALAKEMPDEDDSLKTIKSFDMQEYPVMESDSDYLGDSDYGYGQSGGDSYIGWVYFWIVLLFGCFALATSFLKEEEKEWWESYAPTKENPYQIEQLCAIEIEEEHGNEQVHT